MGNTQPAQQPTANPWANVARTTADDREKADRGLSEDPTAVKVQTTAVKLPANIVYSTLALTDKVLSFEIVAAELCVVDVFVNDRLDEPARGMFAPGKHAYSSHLSLGSSKDNRLMVIVRPKTDDGATRSLKVTLLLKNDDRLLVISKQAELAGRTVELEEVYGIGNAKECVVCLTDMSNTTFVPCRHMCACGDCSKMLMAGAPGERKCPVCRALISSTVNVAVGS